MIKKATYILVIILTSCFCFQAFSQEDSLAVVYAVKKNNTLLEEEQKELNFKSFLFDALQQKAIGNYDKAISALESCQNIKPNNEVVNFEFGKNYYELEKYIEAESYTQKALEADPDNIYMLLLLKKIYNKQNNYKDALEVQKKIAIQKPEYQLDLVLLYIKNNQIDNARELLKELEKNGALSANLIPFKESLLKGQVLTSVPTSTEKPIEEQTIEELKNNFNTDKSYDVIKQLLLKLNDKKQYLDLQNISQESIELFPAQPFVYLMNATSLNHIKQYNKALSVLQSGLDYIVDDTLLEADFYEQISLSYKGLGKNVDATNYYKKAISLRQKKS